LLGKTDPQNSLVLRTSIIGRDRDKKKSLRVVSIAKRMLGYDKAYFFGLTTNEFAKVMKTRYCQIAFDGHLSPRCKLNK